LPFSEFQNYLNENFGEYNLQFEKDFLMRMKDIAIDCFLSAKSSMNPSKRRNSFEFFGFDFMIDGSITYSTNYSYLFEKELKFFILQSIVKFFLLVIENI
jgi:hypothetical protein